MIKDRLPDQGNEYEKPGASSEDTVKFLLNNLEEMNGLWIRITTNNNYVNIKDEEDNIDIVSSLKERKAILEEAGMQKMSEELDDINALELERMKKMGLM
jgi:hypothetical protein